FSHPSASKWFVHPEYYGLLMFERAAPAGSRLLRVSPDPAASSGPNVKVWATRGADGRTRILVVNKDLQAHDLILEGPGLPTNRTAAVQLLHAAPTPALTSCPAGYADSGLCATEGIRLGGR